MMAAPEKSKANNNSMERVKVLQLNYEGKWDDQGIGHVTVDYLDIGSSHGKILTMVQNWRLVFKRPVAALTYGTIFAVCKGIRFNTRNSEADSSVSSATTIHSSFDS